MNGAAKVSTSQINETPTLPTLDSQRISFKVEVYDSLLCKQMLIDRQIVHAISATEEPADSRVYLSYVAELKDRCNTQALLLKSLHSEQLKLLVTLLLEKAEIACTQMGEDAAGVLVSLAGELTQSGTHTAYTPTRAQMVETLQQIAMRLEKQDAAKAARKIRIAGNAIPL
ncbi:MAG: hypothetical protein AAFU84_20470 [Cyanobacteria bacterium J06633_23]